MSSFWARVSSARGSGTPSAAAAQRVTLRSRPMMNAHHELNHRMPERRPHRRAQCLRIHGVRAAAQEHARRRAQRMRRANQRANVAGVLHAVHDQQRTRGHVGQRPRPRPQREGRPAASGLASPRIRASRLRWSRHSPPAASACLRVVCASSGATSAPFEPSLAASSRRAAPSRTARPAMAARLAPWRSRTPSADYAGKP
jgi:hypothetical protein